MGKNSLRGDNIRKTIEEYPYNYNNIVVMKSNTTRLKDSTRSHISNIICRRR